MGYLEGQKNQLGIYDKAQVKEELELKITELIFEEVKKGEKLTQEEIVDKLTEMEIIVTDSTENMIQGEYKDYEVIIELDKDNNVTNIIVGGLLTGAKPTGVVTILTTGEDVEEVEIQVTASTAEGEIQSIEAINKAILKTENSVADKIFTVTKNGKYNFKITGTNGRIAIVGIEVSNIIKTEGSILKAVSLASEEGVQEITVRGRTSDESTELVNYSLNMIIHEGNLVLDGTTEVEGATLTDNVYEFGSTNDVGTASTNAQNTVVLKVKGNLTINNGVTLTSVKSASGYGGPKGMVIYCTGTLTNNGTISMTARGGKAVGQNVYLFDNADGTYEYVPAVGGAGGQGYTNTGHVGYAGSNGSGRALGGGGSGGRFPNANGSMNPYTAAGGAATSYSGGCGSGGNVGARITMAGSSQGGAGGNGTTGWSDYSVGGGAGNPGGTVNFGSSRWKRNWWTISDVWY